MIHFPVELHKGSLANIVPTINNVIAKMIAEMYKSPATAWLLNKNSVKNMIKMRIDNANIYYFKLITNKI